MEQHTILTIAVHESVDLECELAASPDNVTFTWEMLLGEQERKEVDRSQFTQHSTRSVLTFTPRTPGDFGEVICTGTNNVGAGKPCVFSIVKKVNKQIKTLIWLDISDISRKYSACCVCSPMKQNISKSREF